MPGSTFHAGELAVQERLGTRAQSERIATGFFTELPPPAQAFVGELEYLALSLRDEHGAPRAALLSGPVGFLTVRDPRTLVATGAVASGFSVDESAPLEFGAIGLHAPSRRRMRLTGTLEREPGTESFALHLTRAWSNCPKYISTEPFTPRRDPQAVVDTTLTDPAARDLIERTDLFYLATVHATAGLDMSHRGGEPGFVRLTGERTLEWDDFPGNGLYQSLGNLELDPRASLLFPERGGGGAPGRAHRVHGRAHLAEGRIRFEVER